VLFFVEVTPKATSTLSESYAIARGTDNQFLTFTLPETGWATVPLLSPIKQTLLIPTEQSARP
jgi:hypothetical protein